MLSRQCGKATAVFVPSKDRDIVAQVLKMWFHRVGFDFSRAISHNCIAVEQVRVLVVVFFLVFFGFVQQETSKWYIPYDM